MVDRARCVSCGAAAAACPEVFVLGADNGRNRVVERYSVELSGDLSVGVVPEELEECARRGAEICPVEAIRVEPLD